MRSHNCVKPAKSVFVTLCGRQRWYGTETEAGDVRTGQLLSGPLADDVPVYEVRIDEDTVYVKL